MDVTYSDFVWGKQVTKMRSGDIVLLSAHFFEAKTPREQAPTLRNENMDELIVMLGGIYRAWQSASDKKSQIEAHAGDVVYWPKKQSRVEASDPRDPMRCIAIYFTWTRPTIRNRVLVHDNDGLIRILANRLLNLRTAPLPIPASASGQYVAAITAELFYLLSSHIDSLVGHVAQYVETHMSEPFNLTALAAEVGLQRHHFGRRFKALTGITPMEYVRRRKADHALNSFLADPGHRGNEIAAAVGVRNTHQLRRLLKTYYGLSVRDIRQSRMDRAARRNYSAAAIAAHPWMSSITASLIESGRTTRRTRRGRTQRAKSA